MTPQPTPTRTPLPAFVPPVLLGLFGVVSVLLIREFDVPGVSRTDVGLMALSLAALVTSLAWFFALALPRGPLWTLAMLIPYVNFFAASAFARRYWSEGARAPAILAIVSVAGQTLATLRLLLPPTTPLL